MTTPRASLHRSDATADLVVIGGGVIGLAIGAAAAERGLSVALLTAERPGAAMRFMTAARDAYPAYLRWIEDRSGIRVPSLSSGAVEIARTTEERERLWVTLPPGSDRLAERDVAELEPTLAPCAGGVLHPRDGAVDNVSLVGALGAVVARERRVRVLHEPAAAVRFHGGAAVAGADGTRVEAGHVVLAAGAWAAQIDGLPRPVPVRPLRGQICAIRSAPLRHVVLERDVYLVVRGSDRTLVGSTMEDVGFDVGTTPDALAALRRSADSVCPALAAHDIVDSWSGLRPATPDLLPVLGPDPDEPRLIYACGHSRNGILLAPLTASVTGALAAGQESGWDLTPFSIRRFTSSTP